MKTAMKRAMKWLYEMVLPCKMNVNRKFYLFSSLAQISHIYALKHW